MDHLDWFSPTETEVADEIAELHRVLAPGGMLMWRSASKKPWYNEKCVALFFQWAADRLTSARRFESVGFKVRAVGVRDGTNAIDRVNMLVMHANELASC
jgi:betaine lipid synthase